MAELMGFELSENMVMLLAGVLGVLIPIIVFYLISAPGKTTKAIRLKSINASSLKPGTLTKARVPGMSSSVLIAKTASNELHAVSLKCSHDNKSLEGGVLNENRLVCPFHGACFDVRTGDIEDGPCTEHVCHYDVEECKDGTIQIHVPTSSQRKLQGIRMPATVKPDSADKRHFVVIGGGPASMAAVETLRSPEVGFKGKITLISREEHPFYYRIKTSKALQVDVTRVPFTTDRPNARATEKLYKSMGVSLVLGREVERVDAEGKTIRMRVTGDVTGKTSTSISYDKVLCATGGPARTFRPSMRATEKFSIDGADMEGIHVVRYAGDNASIMRDIARCQRERGSKGVRVVVIGASFIGMEIASALQQQFKVEEPRDDGDSESGSEEEEDGPKSGAPQKLKQLCIIDMSPCPLGPMGEPVGLVMQDKAERKNATFRLDHKMVRFEPTASDENRVGAAVVHPNGQPDEEERVPADIVIIGAGMVPVTDYLEGNEGLRVGLRETRGGIAVDAQMHAGKDVYAAGDIAAFPLPRVGASSREEAVLTRVEHWNVATDLGRVAASNMAGKPTTYGCVPFFWTEQWGAMIRYAGSTAGVDRGDLEIIPKTSKKGATTRSLFFYVDRATQEVVAVGGIAADPEPVAAMELLRIGQMPDVDQIRSNDWVSLSDHLRAVTTSE